MKSNNLIITYAGPRFSPDVPEPVGPAIFNQFKKVADRHSGSFTLPTALLGFTNGQALAETVSMTSSEISLAYANWEPVKSSMLLCVNES